MKICLLTATPDNFSAQRIYTQAKEMGHDIEMVNFLNCDMKIKNDTSDILYEGKSLKEFDVVIPRVGSKYIFYCTALVRQCEMMSMYCLNGSLAISRAKDKLRSLQILAKKDIPIPHSFFSHSTFDGEKLVKEMGGAPIIIKLIEGLQGVGVVLADTDQVATSVIEAFSGLNSYFILQEFIKEAKGEDIRCFVVGDKVVASMSRKAKEGEFRSNLHRGGSSQKIKITPYEREIAVKAAKALKLKVAGVDIIRSDQGSMVLEVNSSPGLEGIEKSTGINVAEKIIKFIEADQPLTARKSLQNLL